MILVIDNYDSFTYNLVQYLGEMQVRMDISRNDQISIAQIHEINPDRILISPGPCSPKESGLSNDIIRTFGPRVPLLGVCLGHQCIGHVFGAEVVVNYRMMHGKTSPIRHNGRELFRGMPDPFAATRYHSLVIKRDTVPDCLEITAETAEGEIMGVRHETFPIWGVQFHPESILTENGRQILQNFLSL
jgi:anthranilate synthase/aminodeoxychorismate synthase-like glutamine amidotransferase